MTTTKQPKQTSPATASEAKSALQAVEFTDDVLEYTMRCVLALAPDLSQAIAKAAEAQVRDVFGGDRTYISRKLEDTRSGRNAAIRRDYENGERFELLERRYGLSRVHLWRIVNHLPNN